MNEYVYLLSKSRVPLTNTCPDVVTSNLESDPEMKYLISEFVEF